MIKRNSVDYNEIPWYNALAVSTTEINLDSSKSVEVAPSPIGSILTLSYESFGLYDPNYISFFVKDKYDGYYVDPSASMKYYSSQYNSESYWNYDGAVVNEDTSTTTLDSGSKKVYLFETGNMNCTLGFSYKDGFWPCDESNYTTFENGGDYTAYVYYHGNFLTSTFIGKTSGLSSWYSGISKTWTIFSFTQSWGSSVTAVQNTMSLYTLVWGEEGKATAFSDGSLGIVYAGVGPESYICFFFTDATSGLNMAYEVYDASVFSFSSLNYLYSGNDLIADYGDNDKLYISKDGKTYIEVMEISDESSDDIYVIFYDVSYWGVSSSVAEGKTLVRNRALPAIKELPHPLKK